ncbi:glycoside hydrolase family 19 protein [Massilia sp. TN1-12]|uniref:glycoside hydrolase family 19 protein n=1 Tax=Massilia paldalensis TaxID=3377675 RepID=UPI003850626D
MALTPTQFSAALPRADVQFLPWLNKAIDLAEANTRNRLHMFLATVAHESNDLRTLEENLNYSAEGLRKTWPSRFSDKSSVTYARQPDKIANVVYALRGGNGDEKSGDGWRYRGAGAIQLTFKANQLACAKFFGKKPDEIGAWLRTPEGACLSAAWFWKTRGCNDYADHDDFDGVCDIVNLGRKTTAQGDAIGFVNRLARLRAIQVALKTTT